MVHIRFSGHLTTREMVAVVDRLDRDPRYHATLNELGDFRDLETLALGPQDLANVTNLIFGMYLRSGRSKRIAQIATSPLGRGVAELFKAGMASNKALEVGIFDSSNAALRFLGADGSLPRGNGGRQNIH